MIPTKLFDDDTMENYLSAGDYEALTANHLVLGKAPVPLFYGAEFLDLNTIGGLWPTGCRIGATPPARIAESL